MAPRASLFPKREMSHVHYCPVAECLSAIFKHIESPEDKLRDNVLAFIKNKVQYNALAPFGAVIGKPPAPLFVSPEWPRPDPMSTGHDSLHSVGPWLELAVAPTCCCLSPFCVPLPMLRASPYAACLLADPPPCCTRLIACLPAGACLTAQVFTNKKSLLQPQEEMERHLTDLIKVSCLSSSRTSWGVMSGPLSWALVMDPSQMRQMGVQRESLL